MSRCVKQPIGQKRLTNVAVVRLKKLGKRFEVACYKNKVANWRSGIEDDLDEVLQTEAVFSNVSRGILAKDEDLQQAFGTTDARAVCVRILAEGDVQVSDRERAVELGALFRDVAAAVAGRCVNTATRRPYTVSMIERALKDAGFSVDAKRPAKVQAADAVTLLASRGLPIERARMRLRAVVDPDAAGMLSSALERAAKKRGGGSGGGGGGGDEEAEGGDERESEGGAKPIVIESQDMSLDGTSVTVVFLAEPGLFREIHAAVEGLQGPKKKSGGGGGGGGGAEGKTGGGGGGARLEVVDVAATDAAGAAVAAAGAEAKKKKKQAGGDGEPVTSAAATASADSVASGLRSLRMSPPPEDDDDDDAKGGRRVAAAASSSAATASAPSSSAAPSSTTAAVPAPTATATAPVALYQRGPISSLPAELAGQRRRDLFASLDALQSGWTVELLSRGQGDEGAVVDAVFYSPEGEKVGTFAAARRIALAASKKGGGG